MEENIRNFICIRRDKFLASLSTETIHTQIGINTYMHYVYMQVILSQGTTITSAGKTITPSKI
jgi:hypothetical protein